MAAVQGARVAGARRIIAVDPVEFKREQALRFGATQYFFLVGMLPGGAENYLASLPTAGAVISV